MSSKHDEGCQHLGDGMMGRKKVFTFLALALFPMAVGCHVLLPILKVIVVPVAKWIVSDHGEEDEEENKDDD